MTPRVRRRMWDAIGVAILGIVACIVLYPCILQNSVPWNMTGLYQLPPWEEAGPQLESQQSSEHSTDAGLHHLSNYAFINRAAHAGNSVLWNPLEGCGQPFFAAWRTRALSPFTLPFYLLPFGVALQMSALLKLLAAGCCMYYVARKMGFSTPMALAAAIGFQCSGYCLAWLNQPASDVVVWMPLVIVTAERLAIGQTRLWTLPALVVGLLACGGDPEQLAGALLFGLAYLTLRLTLGHAGLRPTLESLGVYGVAIGAGLFLLAVQVIPFVELAGRAVSTGRGPTGADVGIVDFALCFFPNLLGSSTYETQSAKLMHVGLVPLWSLPIWLSVRGFVRRPQRHRVEAMLLASAGMTVLAVLANGWILSHLPLISRLEPKDFLARNAVVFSLIALAAAEE